MILTSYIDLAFIGMIAHVCRRLNSDYRVAAFMFSKFTVNLNNDEKAFASVSVFYTMHIGFDICRLVTTHIAVAGGLS
jgi:hypothetical protein